MLSSKVCVDAAGCNKQREAFYSTQWPLLVGTKFVYRVSVCAVFYFLLNGKSLKQLLLQKFHTVVPFRLAKRSLTRGLKDKMSFTSLSH
jgi:hypothetical protein